MDCTEIRPLISYYFDGEATPEEQARVERHLAGCEDCRHVLAEYRAIGGGLRDLAIPAPPVGLRRDVWRAIEAQQGRGNAGARVFGAPKAGTNRRDDGKVVHFPQNRKKPVFAGMIGTMESGWSRSLTAALVIGALFLVLGVLILLQNRNTVTVAHIIEPTPISDYTQIIHVQFSSKSVNGNDVMNNTTVKKTSSGATDSVDVTQSLTRTWQSGINALEIQPNPTWEAGATYEIDINKANISTGIGNDKLGSGIEQDSFSTVAFTPTPTATPTNTPVPTETPPPPTKAPTTVAQDTAVPTVVVPGIEPSSTPGVSPSATPEPPKPTDTAVPRPSPTNTHVVPTNTPEPPSATPTHEPVPTSTPIDTATPTPHSGTPTPSETATPVHGTATPRPSNGTPTPTGPCNIMPVNGFGKVWTENPGIANRIGCPVEHETAIQQAAIERFQGGYMFWRGDTKMIYVFHWGSPNDTIGTWQQFPDTWQDGDPEPTPVQAPPLGFYTPVRGFGKLWRENSQIRLDMGYAVETEQAITGAWQGYQHGYALWTDDKIIRFMFNDGNGSGNIWQRFEDTFVMPTATPTP